MMENLEAPWLLYDGDELLMAHEILGNESIKFVGENKKGIVVIFDSGNKDDLQPIEQDLEQLVKILTALKLTLDDVALINVYWAYQYGFSGLVSSDVKFNKMIVFGASALKMGIIFRLKRYMLANFVNVDMLFVDNLATISSEQKLKTELWGLLQIMFGLKKA